jgi:hypothetical protein
MDCALLEQEVFQMKTKLFSVFATVLALFGTTAVAAAGTVSANSGCCPFCK